MDIVNATIDSNFFLQLSLNLIPVIVIVIIGLGGWLIVKYSKPFAFWRKFSIDRAELGLSGTTIIIKPNIEDQQIAYKLWVELSTRKIGLPIDYDHDVIIELYNSWYEFFKLTRELIKDIPITKIKDKDTQAIINLSIDVLNEGLRPHLTKWQARFRKWYDVQLDATDNMHKSPQEIQSSYPDYQQMIEEMRHVNKKLIKYRAMLEKLAFEKG
jgi:hypothetical protein